MTKRPGTNNLPSAPPASLSACRLLLLSVLAFSSLISAGSTPSGATVVSLSYTIKRVQALDTPLFTQGLEIYRQQMLLSSGLYGQSRLISRPLEALGDSTRNRWQHTLNKRYFAEGLTVFANTVYLLSWQAQTLWRFDANTGKPLGRRSYRGEGWGLTHNSHHLIRSDGSSWLYFHEPTSFALKHRLKVTREGLPVNNINELEFAHGFIWANIWLSDEIVAINPTSGEVEAVLNIAKLSRRERRSPPDPDAVANGIAYDARSKRFWLTGKRWSHLYQVQINTDPLAGLKAQRE
jgi:glutamine cyclotransferase